MKRPIVIIALAILVAGCARFNSTITERTLLDGTIEKETVVRAYTLFDSKSELTQLKAGQTKTTQTVGIGSLNQEASASNIVTLTEAVVGAAVRAAIKP